MMTTLLGMVAAAAMPLLSTAELRQEYAPFLQSRPAALSVRARQDLCGEDWRSRFEIKRVSDQPSKTMAPRPESPGWEQPDLDVSAWERTTVPEWRYDGLVRMQPASCILWYRKTFRAQRPARDKRVFLVFEGVDWEAEVWLNGKRLGRHSVYFEPFRFEVTDILAERNTLAVRVIDGPQFGEPAAYWAPFPVPYAEEQRYVRDRARSLKGLRNGDTHNGSGYGIHREVYMETTGPAILSDVLVRGNPTRGQTQVRVETDVPGERPVALQVELLPENFQGTPYTCQVPFAPEGSEGRQTVTVPIPEARLWSPEAPWLYRCRVSLLNHKEQVVDARDAVFGYRSIEMVSEVQPREGLQPGTLLLNGRPVFLRGANIQGLNAFWFWGERDKLLDVLCLLKAAHFNAVRSCQHIQFPEVRELLDRYGILSQQDVGSRYPQLGQQTRAELVHAAGVAAKVCYNNPGVALLTFANETDFNPAEMLQAAVAIDPERLFVPISGRTAGGSLNYVDGKNAWGTALPAALRARVLDSFHPYWGWYPERAQPWKWCRVMEPGRLVQVGEFGGEALDDYETMKRYPRDWGTLPSRQSDTLWGQVQVKKQDQAQILGLRGRQPSNLGEYIEASQNYQYDLLCEITKAMRLSPQRIAAYFQFHFVDVLPANWPKSIVSHDLKPKRGYFAMAQCNQPLVPLPRLIRDGQAMELWVANDLPESYPGCRIRWQVLQGEKVLAEGGQSVDVPASGAVLAGTASLTGVPEAARVVELHLRLEGFPGGGGPEFTQEVYLAAWRQPQDSIKP